MGVIVKCCSKKCKKRRIKEALNKLANIENQDRSNIYMLVDGKSIEFDIRVNR